MIEKQQTKAYNYDTIYQLSTANYDLEKSRLIEPVKQRKVDNRTYIVNESEDTRG